MGRIKFFILISIFTFLAFSGNAQQMADSVPQVKKHKAFNHYVGLQANQLFKQFLNLDANGTIVKNPYLLTYAVTYSKLHLGIQGGFGYSYSLTKDKLSPSDLQSKVNNVFYRGGIFRNYIIGKKWEATTGVNYVGYYKLNRTVAFSVIHSGTGNVVTDSTATISTDLSKRKGTELQLSLGFHLSEHIMLFTEASFHYYMVRSKSNVLVSETVTNSDIPENDTFTLSTTNSDNEDASFDISLPLVLFLTIKF